MFNRNRIFMDRVVNVGPISAEKALNYGFTGPNLRAAGVDYDVRAMNPYSSYEDFEFDVPVGTNGDTLRPVYCPQRGNLAEPAHHQASAGQPARRPLPRRCSALLPAHQAASVQEHGGPDLPLQNHHG
jgi:hypothetical protein